MKTKLRHTWRKIIPLLFLSVMVHAISSSPAYATNQILILSGGDSPANDHYSQYLQTRTLFTNLQKRFGSDRVSVFFGAGNNDKNPRLYPDVNSSTTKNGITLNNILYGTIPANSPATRQSVENYFQSQQIKNLGKDDVFFFFVSDHGMPNQKAKGFDNNCINLWAFDTAKETDGDWNAQCLSKNELKELLDKNVHAARRVFAMSQCYSGGFHQMSVDSSGAYPTADINTCGFTSVPEDLMASGCTEDVETDQYQGYERDFTEQMTGHAIITGKQLGIKSAASPYAAHEAAVLLDMTIDEPMSTSDYYLREWYYALWNGHFKPRAGTLATKELQKISDEVTSIKWGDEKIISHSGPLAKILQERLRDLHALEKVLFRGDPDFGPSIVQTGEEDLNAKSAELNQELNAGNKQYNALDKSYRKIRYEKIFKNWVEAVRQNKVAGLSDEERKKFEADFFDTLDASYKTSPLGAASFEHEYLLKLASLTHTDPASAKRIADYESRRDKLMRAWARSTGDSGLIAAADELDRLQADKDKLDTTLTATELRVGHIQRILEKRRELAAAVVIVQMNDVKAITELKGLDGCEKSDF